MGYEIQLIAGEIGSTDTFIEIARIDLAKIGNGPLHNLISYAKGKETPSFIDWKFLKDVKGNHLDADSATSEIFGIGMDYKPVSIWEGDEKISEDPYGDPLPAIPLLHILAAINQELKLGSYRRFSLAKSLLDAFASSSWDNIYIVPYGH
jgi:hypothetical protein